MNPLIIQGLVVVDGPVGVGKTTFIKNLEAELTQAGGKVKIIEELIPSNLEQYYADPKNESYKFQRIFIQTLLEQWYTMSNALKSGQYDYVICDRYFASTRGFIKYQKESEFLTDEQEQELLGMITLATRACPIFPEFFVFINDTNKVCNERIKMRSRKGEEDLDAMIKINDCVRMYNNSPFLGIGPEDLLQKMGKLEKYLSPLEGVLRVSRNVKVVYLTNLDANSTEGTLIPQNIRASFSKILSEGRFHQGLRDQIFRDCMVAMNCPKSLDETIRASSLSECCNIEQLFHQGDDTA